MTTETKTRIQSLPDGTEVMLVSSPLWWQTQGLSYTSSGYGAKIPTRWVVRLDNRTRRVYCTIYSNIGACWIVRGGQKVVIS